MHPELAIIKLFLQYTQWKQYSGYIAVKWFQDDLQPIYRILNKYHEDTPETNISVLDLISLVNINLNSNKEYYINIINNINNIDINNNITIELINSIKRNKLLKDISIKSYEVTEGKSKYEDLLPLLSELDKPDVAVEETQFITDDLNILLSDCVTTPGLRWRLNGLNKSLGSLRSGDFGFIFARPETGKTTLLASESTFFAEQVKDNDGPGIWINNEEQNKKVKLRTYQAALGITMPELMAKPEYWMKVYREKIRNKLVIPDMSTYSYKDIERLCEVYQPSFLVLDQIDKIKGFKADRDDLMLGAMYQWARELAKEYCPIIAVCQADGTGENTKWLTMANVANAKTSKQAEADWILGVGKIHEPGWDSVRFMNISKNKLFGDPDSDPTMKHGKFETIIEPLIARYRDV